MTKKHAIAYVEWVDSAVVAGGWDDMTSIIGRVEHGELLTAAGLLVDDRADGIVLCAGYNPFLEQAVSCVAIPRSAIRRLELWDPDGGQ